MSLALLAGGLIGALLLVAAEFTPLYEKDTPASKIPLHTVQTGSHDAYALIPIALLAIVLSIGAVRSGSRPALLALGALGILTVAIALVADLPDAHATGLVGSAAVGFSRGKDVPRIGLYLETLGAALLVVTSGAGLLMTGPRSVQTPAG